MGRPEGVVDVGVRELGQTLRQLGVVLGLTWLEAHVLQHQYVAAATRLSENARTSSPTTPGASVTSAVVSSDRRSAAGRSDSSGSRSAGRPRCEAMTRRAPRARSASIV